MDKKDVVKFLSKKILNNTLQAHLNTKQDLLVLDVSSTDVNELQQLSLQYCNHIQTMVQQNERLLDVIHIKTEKAVSHAKDKKKAHQAAANPADPGEADAR